MVDEIQISQEPCYQRDKSCEFNSPQEDCFFNIDRGELIVEDLEHLYKKDKFEPEIVENDFRPATIITSPDDGSYNFVSEPFYMAPPFYDSFCLLFKLGCLLFSRNLTPSGLLLVVTTSCKKILFYSNKITRWNIRTPYLLWSFGSAFLVKKSNF